MAVTREDIAGPLREQLRAGDYQPGARLPSARELAAKYGASRVTANAALRVLADEGFIALKDKSRAVAKAPGNTERPPEARLNDAVSELRSVQDEVRETRVRLTELEKRVTTALAKLRD